MKTILLTHINKNGVKIQAYINVAHIVSVHPLGKTTQIIDSLGNNHLDDRSADEIINAIKNHPTT